MNHIWKIFLMNKFYSIFLFFAFSYGHIFNDWAEKNKNLLLSESKLISFNFTERIKGGQILYGEFSLNSSKEFRLEMDSRTVVSDGFVWKSYDWLVDQVFIQNKDLKLEKNLFSWIRYEKVKSIKVKKQNNGSYKIKAVGLKPNIYVFFNSDYSILDSIILIDQNEYIFFNIQMAEIDSINLDIGLKSSEIFDLR